VLVAARFALADHYPSNHGLVSDWYNHAQYASVFLIGFLVAFNEGFWLSLERLRWLEEARRAQVQNETERMRSTLLGAIGHDLRTPLAAIHGAASSLLLPGEVSESTRRDLLAMIQDESERLAHLLGNLLDLTRLESGAVQIQKEWQPLEEVLGSALGRLERLGALPVEVELPEQLALAPFDAALLEQVLLNLLANAQRHAPGEAVSLRAWSDPAWLHLEVADRGPGIPEAFRERVFDKFFRLPGAGEGGVGLGLAICKAIMQAHGGTIQAQDRPGGGTTFCLALPMDGPPPAVVNALENALGALRLDEVPMTPDRLLERCEEVSHG